MLRGNSVVCRFFIFVLLIQLTHSTEKFLSFVVFMPISTAAAFWALYLTEKKNPLLKKHAAKLLAARLLVMFAIMLFLGFNNMQEYTESIGLISGEDRNAY